MTTTTALSTRRLYSELKSLTLDPPTGILAYPLSEDDIYTWEALITGSPATPFEHGILTALLTFPRDYPLSPPSMRFTSPHPLFHPNVYPDGTVCISILHPPGDDPLRYELASERWSPVQSVEKILLSVLSMLAEPNDESPANVEAAKMWRVDRKGYEDRVRREVRASLGL